MHMRVRRLTVVLISALLLGAACANSNDAVESATTTPGETVPSKIDPATLKVHHPVQAPGVTDREIGVSVVAAITNPLGADYTAFGKGINAYFAMVNAEGGLYGRELKVIKVRDDLLGNNDTEVKAALAEDDPFAMFIATTLFTGADTLAAESVPTFGWNINAEWAGHDTFFQNAAAICFTCAIPVWPWLAEKVGARKPGIVAYTAPQSTDCAKLTAASFEKFPTADVAFEDTSLPFGVLDVSAQVARMKEEGVDLVYTCIDLNGAFTFAKEMKKQGLDVPLVMPNSYDQAFMKANGSYFEGSYVTANFTALEHRPQPPEMQTFMRWMEKTGQPVKELAVQGWIAANQFVTGLKLAGPDFDRAKLVAALNAQKDFTAHGMVAPIDWSIGHENPKDHLDDPRGLDCWNWVKVENNEFVSQFAEDGKPWVCAKVADEKRTSNAPMDLPPTKNYSFVDTGL
jgi:branched-chain amino acid transport system substrate-binding protein